MKLPYKKLHDIYHLNKKSDIVNILFVNIVISEIIMIHS